MQRQNKKNYPTKPIFCSVQKMYCIWCKFSIIIKRTNARTAPSKCVIWCELSEEHEHQRFQKSTIFDDHLTLFWCNQNAD